SGLNMGFEGRSTCLSKFLSMASDLDFTVHLCSDLCTNPRTCEDAVAGVSDTRERRQEDRSAGVRRDGRGRGEARKGAVPSELRVPQGPGGEGLCRRGDVGGEGRGGGPGRA